MMEKILGDQSQRKSTVRASQNVIEKSQKKGGGPIKDLNISDIDKNEEDDPNQLFSLRQAIAEMTPERDSSNSRSPDNLKAKSNLL